MSDPPPEVCPTCGKGPLERVLFPVAVHFKGSGFYTTDYGRGSRRPKDGGESGGGESGSAGGDSGPGGGAGRRRLGRGGGRLGPERRLGRRRRRGKAGREEGRRGVILSSHLRD